jgi:hypothetical protein
MSHRAGHALAGCGAAIVVAGTTAIVTGLPWLFPSLGPTATLQTEQPTSAGSTPRNTLIGHAVTLGAGYGCLLLFNLQAASPAPTAGMSASRIGAAALSLAVTAATLLLVRRPHAPGGCNRAEPRRSPRPWQAGGAVQLELQPAGAHEDPSSIPSCRCSTVRRTTREEQIRRH